MDVIDASNYILSQFTSVAAFKAAVAAGFTVCHRRPSTACPPACAWCDGRVPRRCTALQKRRSMPRLEFTAPGKHAPPAMQITWNPLFAPATLLGFKSPFVPCHFGLWCVSPTHSRSTCKPPRSCRALPALPRAHLPALLPRLLLPGTRLGRLL